VCVCVCVCVCVERRARRASVPDVRTFGGCFVVCVCVETRRVSGSPSGGTIGKNEQGARFAGAKRTNAMAPAREEERRYRFCCSAPVVVAVVFPHTPSPIAHAESPPRPLRLWRAEALQHECLLGDKGRPAGLSGGHGVGYGVGAEQGRGLGFYEVAYEPEEVVVREQVLLARKPLPGLRARVVRLQPAEDGLAVVGVAVGGDYGVGHQRPGYGAKELISQAVAQRD